MASDGERAHPLEILGSWLGIWTAPHDVVVPPPPSGRTLALLGLGLAAVIAAIALFVAPALRDTRERNAERDERRLAAIQTAYRERVEREQQPRLGVADGARRIERLTVVEAKIGADARRRFDPDARAATCEPVAGADAAARRVAYDCHTSVRDIVGAGAQQGARGDLAIPYRVVIDFRTGRYAFCKLNPPPGERALPDPRTLVELPPPCRVPR